MKRLAFILAVVFGGIRTAASPNVEWLQIYGVSLGQSYDIGAHGWADESDPDYEVTTTIYKNGAYLGSGCDNRQSEVWVSTVDYSIQATYDAYASASGYYTATSTVHDPCDHQGPSQPTNLTADQFGASTLRFSWNPATDNSGVICGYRYGCFDNATGSWIAQDETTGTCVTIGGLQSNRTYSLRVYAWDWAGWLGGEAELTVTFVAGVPPAISAHPQSQIVNLGSNVTLQVTAGGSAIQYQWKKDNANISGATSASYAITNFQATNAGSYTVVVSSYMGSVTSNAAVLSLDNTPPTVPVLAAPATGISRTGFTVTWSASSDGSGVAYYEIEQNGVPYSVVGTSYSFSGLSPGASYVVKVRARDSVGNWSGWSNSITVATNSDTVAPSVPTSLGTSNIGTTSLSLSWTASTDDVAVTGYQVRRDGTVIALVTDPNCTVTGLNPGVTYVFGVRACDAADNWSAWSDAAAPLSVTTQAPGANTLLERRVFAPAGSAPQTYTVPAETDFIVIKVWGAGGGYTPLVMGGAFAAGYATATFNATPGEQYTVYVGLGGSGSTVQTNPGLGGWPGGCTGNSGYGGGGGYSRVQSTGWSLCASGGLCAYPGVIAGTTGVTGPGYNFLSSYPTTWGAPPGGTTDPDYPGVRVGCAGDSSNPNGGGGRVVVLAYKTPGTNPTQTFYPTEATQTYTVPAGGDHVIVKAWGGGAGATGGTPGAAGSFGTLTYNVTAGQTISIAAGAKGAAGGGVGGITTVTLPGSSVLRVAGGGNGTSSVTNGSQTPTAVSLLAGNGATTANVSDTNYPGNNTGNGGTNGGTGGSGAVVVVLYAQAPVITSTLTQTRLQNASVTYAITSSNGATAYGATGLPPGLVINTATGSIYGWPSVPGTYSSTISASNCGGTTTATLVWTITADTTAPTVPVGLQAANLTDTGFTLTWTAANDNAGATVYEVRRDGGSLGTVGTGCSMQITGLTTLSTYSMRVRAGDSAGNWSEWSAPLSVTTPTAAAVASPDATLVRFAVRYWRGNDYPGNQINEPQYEWVDGEEGEEGSYQWVDHWISQPDGIYGSRWDTGKGTFLVTDTSGNYNNRPERGYLANTYAVGDELTFHAWAYAPLNNAPTLTYSLYNPNNQLATSGSLSNNSYAEVTRYTLNLTGVWRISLGYSGATTITPSSASLSYYVSVGSAPPTAPAITTQPSPLAQTINAGASVTYTVAASGAAPITYQWQKNGVDLSGQTGTSLSLANVSAADIGSYTVVVSNIGGSTTSNILSLTVITPPTIVTSPAGANVAAGGSLTFSVGATGTTPFSYQWRKNGANLNGETRAVLTLSNIETANAGTYSVVVTNAAGSATSGGAVLTVAPLSSVATTLNYADRSATSVTLTWNALANSLDNLGYRIYRGTTAIASTTELVYVDSGLTAGTSYTYSVKLLDATGAESSAAATLTVTTTNDYTADSDHDGVPDVAEAAILTIPHNDIVSDSANTLQLKIQRPTR